MPRAKLRSTANREIFVSGEAHGAGILDMYSEHRQRCLARKDPVCGCRIPNLHALIERGGFFLISFGSSMPRLRRKCSGTPAFSQESHC